MSECGMAGQHGWRYPGTCGDSPRLACGQTPRAGPSSSSSSSKTARSSSRYSEERPGFSALSQIELGVRADEMFLRLKYQNSYRETFEWVHCATKCVK